MGPFDDLIPEQNRVQQNPYAITQPQTQSQLLQQDNTRANTTRTQQEIQNNPLTRANAQTNIAQGQASIQNQHFNQNQGLRQEFNNLPQVKTYSDAIQSLGAALQAPDTPQGDLAIVYSFAKAMDPGSVVREGEMDMANSTASQTQQLQQYIQAIQAGKRLPPAVRTGLVETMRQRVSAMRQAYDQQRSRYSDLAAHNGMSAEQIVGQPLYEAYRPLEENYIRAHGGTPKINGVPVDGLKVAPSQTEAGFGLKQDDKAASLSREQADAYDAWFRANPNPSPEELVTFGKTLKLNIPLDNAKAIIAAKKAGGGISHDVQTIDPRVTQKLEELRAGGTGGGQAFGLGAGDAITLGSADEISAAGQALRGALNGEGSFGDLYNVNSDANRQFLHEMQQGHPALSLAGGLLGGMATPIGMGASGALDMAKAGATAGGIYGFNSGEGGMGNRALNGVTGAAIGGAAGAAIPQFFRSVGDAVRPRSAMEGEQALERIKQIQAAQAAQSLNIDLPRFVAGGPMAQRMGAMAEQSQVAAPIMRRASNKLLNQSEARRDETAGLVGNVIDDPDILGGRAISGAKATSKANKDMASRLYQKADELNGGTRYPMPNAAAALDQQIAELSDTPGGVSPAILATFKDVRSKIDGEWSPEGIKRMRTGLSDRFVESGMSQGDASRRARIIVDAAEQDIVQGMRAAGKTDAAAVLKAASQKWAQNEQIIERVFQPILGINKEKTGAEVARGLVAAAKNNPGTMRKFIANMPEEQANDLRASIIGQMGNPGAGKQDVEGRAFSLDTFLTHWNNLKHVRNEIFDPQTIGALNKLAQVADRAKQYGRVENHSNTGSIAMGMMNLGAAAGAVNAPVTALMGHPGVAAAQVISALTVGLGQVFGAKLLANPNFARRLAQTPENPAAAIKYWNSKQVIGNLIRSEPALQAEIVGFQRALNDNLAPRAAASNDPDEEKKKQYPY